MEEIAAAEIEQQPAGQPEQDYKALYEQTRAESRKWEGRSKANAKELEALRRQPAQDRTVEDRLAALETENAALKAAKARAEMVREVATATGLQESIVASLNGTGVGALDA